MRLNSISARQIPQHDLRLFQKHQFSTCTNIQILDHGVEFSLQTDILVGTAEALRYPARWACQAHKSLSSLARCLDKRGEQVHAVTDAAIEFQQQQNSYVCVMASVTGLRLTQQSLRFFKHGFLPPSGTLRQSVIGQNRNCLAQRSIHTGCRLLNPAYVQHPAPDFKAQAVVDGQFKELQLSDFKGKYLVLFFYPLDFTFVCPTEIIAFSDNVDKFKAINAEVVGVSTDSHFSHLAWINTPRKQGGLGDLKYPLLADFNKTISQDYGVLLKEEGVALRGLFIIDPKGIVRQITINDLPVGRSVDEVLRLIKAFQFVEKHGEVCPANWQPDSATIKPTPEGSKNYFEKVN
ncbi:thioredoxin-dependent peroxide reductase, mitochondrial [Plakobranchus ocellatus]|uniref:Thioredoxin peroxidase n=1 Tax=Plakobranchus ocellatus TaxID=259542 RepID=A0AAV4DQ81_9GAST|nr:thioredoxin-dependent peroxide reductase, mitochondrial [Plakobranchus ocellatus]